MISITMFVASFAAGLFLQRLFRQLVISAIIPFLLYVYWSVYIQFFTPYRSGGGSFWPSDIFFVGSMGLVGGFLGGYISKLWPRYLLLQLTAGLIVGTLSIWGLWGPAWILQSKANDLIGSSEAEVIRSLGSPHRIIGIEEDSRVSPRTHGGRLTPLRHTP